MEQRIKVITLGVDDLEKSLAFYRDGWVCRHRGSSAWSSRTAPWSSST